MEKFQKPSKPKNEHLLGQSAEVASNSILMQITGKENFSEDLNLLE